MIKCTVQYIVHLLCTVQYIVHLLCTVQYIVHLLCTVQYIVHLLCTVQYIVHLLCAVQYIVHLLSTVSISLVRMKVRDCNFSAWVRGQEKVSEVLVAFGLLSITMLRSVLAWRAF
jgi:hypothetical protein